MNCFLIDDDQDDQDFFSLALEELTIKVSLRKAYNGIDALALLNKKNYKPDVIFIDINMPRMDGWECLAEIKKINALTYVPIIIYTTSDNYFTPSDLKAKGVMGFVTKQPSISSLVVLLEALFEKIIITKTYAD